MCINYFPSSIGFFVAMLVNEEFGPYWPWRDCLPLYMCAHDFRSYEVFLDLTGNLDADV